MISRLLSWLALTPYERYLQSPGWALTKWLRKRSKCAVCGARTRLELHHDKYDYHNCHPILRWWLPNMGDPMRTLCHYHHGLINPKRKG